MQYRCISSRWRLICLLTFFSITGCGESTTDADAPGGYPASILDLSAWKLTLPIDTGRNDGPDEIKQPDLQTFRHPDYFHLNDSGDGVVFHAPISGKTTSGSNYPRSELREMTDPDGREGDGWSTTSGTHTMTIRQAITALPLKKPHLIAGQIHDEGEDVIVIRLEDKRLFVVADGDELAPDLDSNYTLGDVFTVKIEATAGKVRVYYNDKLKVEHEVSTSDCYFKAGCYVQSNKKQDGEKGYGEVVIYDLKLQHTGS